MSDLLRWEGCLLQWSVVYCGGVWFIVEGVLFIVVGGVIYCSGNDIYLCMSDKSSTFVLRFEKGMLFLPLEEHFFNNL